MNIAQPKIKFLLNGHQINNDFIDDPKQVLSNILLGVPNIEYWAPEALKEMVTGSIQMIVKYAQEVKKTLLANKQKTSKISSFITWANNIVKNLDSKTVVSIDDEYPGQESNSSWDRAPRSFSDINTHQLLKKVYDLILAADGLSVLPGFSSTNQKAVGWKA